jgi:hypothetical protein
MIRDVTGDTENMLRPREKLIHTAIPATTKRNGLER